MKTSILLRTLIFIVFSTSCVLTAQISCSSDDACNFGICTNSGNSRYCSCLSGFGGSSCQNRPSSSCPVQNVTSETANFDPFVTLQYTFPSQLVLDVTTGIQESKYENVTQGPANNTFPYSLETIIYFGNGSFPECTFPNALWDDFTALSSDCLDRYRLNITFVDAMSKCGFDNPSENRTYEQTLTIERKYLIMESRGMNLTRTETRTFYLKIIFPEGANVTTSSVRVSYTASATPSISPSTSSPPAQTYSQVTMTISSSLDTFNPTEFKNAISSILNITSDRIEVVSLAIASSKSNTKQTSAITVIFRILDASGSSAAGLSAILVQMVASGDPILVEYGLIVIGIDVDNSHAADNLSSSSDDGIDKVLLYAILFPALAAFLAGLVIAGILIVRRIKNNANRQDMPEAPQPDKSPGISRIPSFPGPPTPPDMPAISVSSPPPKPLVVAALPQSFLYPDDMTQSTRLKSRQVTMELMTQLKQMRQQTAVRTNKNNNNNNNNNNNTKVDDAATMPISRPPSYSPSATQTSVQPSLFKSNTKMSRVSQPSKLKQNFTQASKKQAPPPKDDSDSDSSWIATPDSLTSDSDDE